MVRVSFKISSIQAQAKRNKFDSVLCFRKTPNWLKENTVSKEGPERIAKCGPSQNRPQMVLHQPVPCQDTRATVSRNLFMLDQTVCSVYSVPHNPTRKDNTLGLGLKGLENDDTWTRPGWFFEDTCDLACLFFTLDWVSDLTQEIFTRKMCNIAVNIAGLTYLLTNFNRSWYVQRIWAILQFSSGIS